MHLMDFLTTHHSPLATLPLAVGFITPAFAIAGLAAISIPIIIHLLNRRRYKILDWAAMQFLLEAMRKNRRRLKFEQWILLATRCALIGLLGLALARPFGCADSTVAQLAGRSAAMHVIVIDNSYSMAYEADRPDTPTHLDHAKKLANQLIDRLSSGGDSVVLITASQPAEAVIAKPSYDLAGAVAAVDRIQQKFTGTDLAGALTLAEQIGKDEQNQPSRTLHLFSDATTSAWRNGNEPALEALGKSVGDLYTVCHYNLSLPNQFNAAVLDVEPSSNLVRTRFANDFRALARAYGTTVESSILWKLGDETLPGGSSISLDAQTEPITQSNAQLRAGGSTVISAQIAADDRLKIDNFRSHAIEIASEMKILIVEGRRGMGPLDGSGAFLDLALAPPTLDSTPGSTTSSYIKPERISDIELAGKVLGDYRAVMLTDVAQLAAPVADQLAAYVKQGGTVVWFMGEQVQRENYNNVLVPRELIPGPLTQRQTGQNFTFAFNPAGNNHPLLQAFSNIDKSGLDTAQVFTYWEIQPRADLNVEPVLAFNSTAATPELAITRHTLGEGTVVFFATTADAEWTSFPAKPAYVTLMHEIVAGTVSGSERWMNLQTGQRIEIPTTRELGGVPILRDPETNKDIPLEQSFRPDGTGIYRSEILARPGVYRLSAGSTVWPVSVNLPSDEADIRPLGDEAIKTALGGIDVITLGAELPAQALAEEEGSDFGWTLMTIVLVLLGVECFMAMRFGHYKRGGASA
jgi:hypothetical protein